MPAQCLAVDALADPARIVGAVGTQQRFAQIDPQPQFGGFIQRGRMLPPCVLQDLRRAAELRAARGQPFFLARHLHVRFRGAGEPLQRREFGVQLRTVRVEFDPVGKPQQACAPAHVGVDRRQRFDRRRMRAEGRVAFAQQADARVDLGQQQRLFGLHVFLAVQFAEPALALFDQLARQQAARRCVARIGLLEGAAHERRDGAGAVAITLRACTRLLRRIALGAQFRRLPQRDRQREQHAARRQCDHGCAHPVAAQEFPDPIQPVVARNRDRMAGQPGAQIACQIADFGVALGGVLAQAVRHDRVQFAAQRLRADQ